MEEIAKEVANGVEAAEPGVAKYQWFKTGTPQEPKIVVWEVYVTVLPLTSAPSESPMLIPRQRTTDHDPQIRRQGSPRGSQDQP